jgi:hypothetical protein
MKKAQLFYILLALFGLLMTPLFFHSVAYSAPSDSEGGDANTSDVTNGLYKTFIDQPSGRYALVNMNGDIVTLWDETGNIIWSTNVIKGMQLVGESKISGMQVYKGELWVNIGKGYGVIDIKTGAIKGMASN